MKLKNRHRLKNKEIKELLAVLHQRYSGNFFSPQSSVEIGTLEDYTVILVDDDIDFFQFDDTVVFTLSGLYKYHPQEYFVVVDMGAVGFVTKGADVMTPGIVDADDHISPGDYVWVCDENHKKPLAVGKALISGEEMLKKQPGKAIKTIHYIGDTLWTLTHT